MAIWKTTLSGMGIERHRALCGLRRRPHLRRRDAPARRLLSDAWERYRSPLAVTESHLGCTREEQMRWLLETWCGESTARSSGLPVLAVTAWALFGSYDWDSLLTHSSGHYEPGAFDVRSEPARATALATAGAT